MSDTSERIRAELKAETGVDFADYRDDDLIDAVTGWSGLLGLAGDFLVAVGVGLGIAVAGIVIVLTTAIDGEAGAGMSIGAAIAGLGAVALTFGLRARHRIPGEIDRVFDLTSAMVDRVADDIEAGTLTVTTGQAARGLAIVAAAPALTRVAQRRFPLVGTLAAPIAGALMTKVLARVWPKDLGGEHLHGLDRPARKLEGALDNARRATVPRLTRAVRWATLPLLIGGCLVIGVGGVVGLIALVTA